jgi:hypothetical protein
VCCYLGNLGVSLNSKPAADEELERVTAERHRRVRRRIVVVETDDSAGDVDCEELDRPTWEPLSEMQ